MPAPRSGGTPSTGAARRLRRAPAPLGGAAFAAFYHPLPARPTRLTGHRVPDRQLQHRAAAAAVSARRRLGALEPLRRVGDQGPAALPDGPDAAAAPAGRRVAHEFVSLVTHGLSAMSVFSDRIGVGSIADIGGVGVGAVALIAASSPSVRLHDRLAIPGWATSRWASRCCLLLAVVHAAPRLRLRRPQQPQHDVDAAGTRRGCLRAHQPDGTFRRNHDRARSRYVGEELAALRHRPNWKRYVREQLEPAHPRRRGRGRSGHRLHHTASPPDQAAAGSAWSRTRAHCVAAGSAGGRHSRAQARGVGRTPLRPAGRSAVRHDPLHRRARAHRRRRRGAGAGRVAPPPRRPHHRPLAGVQWLYIAFDRAIGHLRRYTRATLQRLQPASTRVVASFPP